MRRSRCTAARIDFRTTRRPFADRQWSRTKPRGLRRARSTVRVHKIPLQYLAIGTLS